MASNYHNLPKLQDNSTNDGLSRLSQDWAYEECGFLDLNPQGGIIVKMA
jgi:hypothetical protein